MARCMYVQLIIAVLLIADVSALQVPEHYLLCNAANSVTGMYARPSSKHAVMSSEHML